MENADDTSLMAFELDKTELHKQTQGESLSGTQESGNSTGKRINSQKLFLSPTAFVKSSWL